MFSVSPAEILTIGAIALIVFGPKRLPEIARRAGSVIRDLRDTAADLRRGIESEYQEAAESLSEVRRSMGSTLDPKADDAGPGA
ncbi:MAG TPA: twin-arginine translocase TatA/TatE family subunit [Acidimicrobiia bacterium]|nr:twin-arginine translocase TatA/TatE family subunit [Acidimicrobiia bacterium]